MSSRVRRVVAMITASLAVLSLGFVVAVASRSLPGATAGEPLLDLDFRVNLDLSPILAWILLILAVVGGVLFALRVREGKQRELNSRRNILSALIGFIVFLAVFRWLRPAVERLLGEGAAATESATDAIADGRAGTASGWLFSLLLAAVLAATLTRIGLSIKSAGSPFEPEPGVEDAQISAPAAQGRPVARSLGHDPRSRILNAYQEFELELAAAGQPRAETDTTGRHAVTAGRRLGLDPELVDDLVGRHAAARYGSSEPAESDASRAEQSSLTLQEWMTR